MKIVPTVFSKNKEEFNELFGKVKSLGKDIHVDIMDGKFVKTKSIKVKDLPDLKKNKKNFEAHLMVEKPERYIEILKKKGFSKILFHYEAIKSADSLNRLIHLIKHHKMKPWIVFNVGTDFNKINDVLERMHSIKGVMFMGHKTGVQGKALDLNAVRRARNIKNFFPKVKVEIDGAVNDKTIVKLKNAKVDIVAVGSFLSKAKDSKKAMGVLKEKVK